MASVPPPEPPSLLSRVGRVLLRLAQVTLALLLVAAFSGWLLLRSFEKDLPDISTVRTTYRPPQVTRILARDGSLLAELFTERRTVVPIASLPAHVKLAVLAAEDAGFYEHQGVNYLGIVRAMIVNLRAGRTRQGGSTITQQVVKNILIENPERTSAARCGRCCWRAGWSRT
jgi:penicillin-binding protein 1A